MRVREQKFKLVVFDLDGTIIDNIEYVWKTMHEFFGLDRHPERIAARKDYTEKKITYNEWARRDLELLSEHGATKPLILKAVSKAKLMEGARETLSELKRRGYRLALISGSIDLILDELLPDYKEFFDYVFVNKIFFDGEGRISGFEATPFDMEHKRSGLIEICKREKLSPSQAIFVGDNENDLDIAKAAGLTISFNSSSPELDEIADVVIRKKNLAEILGHLE